MKQLLFQLFSFFSKSSGSNSKEYFSDKIKIKTENFNFDLISNYFYHVVEYKSFFHIISDKIKNDLDLDEIFRFIDRTSSKIGQQFLYFKLRAIEGISNLQKFEKLIHIFENDNAKTVFFQKKLSKLNTDNTYYFENLIHGKQIDKPKSFYLTYILAFFSFVFIGLSFYNPIFFAGLLGVFIINFVFHYQNKIHVNNYIIAVSEFEKSYKTAKLFSKDNDIKAYFDDFSFLETISKIRNKTRFISFEKQITGNDFYLIIWSIYEIVKILFNIEIILFYRFIDDIIREKDKINKLFTFIGEIDSAISIAVLRAENITQCKPVFTNKKHIEVKEIIHPLIEHCVANSLTLTNKSLLLTGSNMSGKTTFIRIVSLNSILAQTINTCFAKEYIAPFFKIYSSIRISDNLFSNTSYYLEEVLTIKEFLSASENRETCFFVLDEIFKGTNTAERISAGNAILSYLNKTNHLVFVSTHDIELTELLKQNGFELFHFQEQIIDNQLIFDHKLKQGKLKTKNAIKILELYRYPNEIINNAFSTLKIFDKMA